MEQRNWRQPPAHSILFFLSTSALPNELNEEKRRIDGHWGPREQSSHQSSTKKNKIILFLFDWWNWCAAVPAEESGRIELPFFFFGCGLWAQSAIGNNHKEKTKRKHRALWFVFWLVMAAGPLAAHQHTPIDSLLTHQLLLWFSPAPREED